MFKKKSKNILSASGGKTVFVGLSGGVDSSVSAALLKEAGFDVVGVFIRVWQPDWISCTWKEDRRDAMRVCAHLDIPFLMFDFEDVYKRKVADYMIEEYKRGRTPNPDVMCNKYIKFGAFFDKARSMGADYVATGHYAQVEQSEGYKLLKGVDDGKDQSYFLWTLNQDQLSKIMFPVGGYKKEYVRKLARTFGLPTETKKDSQGVCFLGKLDMKDFLKHYIDENKGEVINEKGDVIGWHSGAVFFTLGERHGFIITKKGTDDKPYYIIAKDMDNNTLIVSDTPQESISERKEIIIEKTNWITDVPQSQKKYQARIRHLGEFHECEIISVDKDSATLKFHKALLASPGQSFVLYYGEECLGGGIIT